MSSSINVGANTEKSAYKNKKTGSMMKNIYRDWQLYLMLLPVILYYVVFKYAPLVGLTIAFKDYKFSLGIFGSKWVGLKYFANLFHSSEFFLVVRNTLLLNIYGLLVGFPVPIVLAILFNEMRIKWFKKTLQQLMYLPHFLSWVVMGQMVIAILSPKTGLVNTILQVLTGNKIFFMASNFWWPWTYVFSGIWKDAGWGTIIYMAAITGVDTQLYEAAVIDGANKWKQIWHITIPSISTTIIILLILKMGYMMDIGFEHIYMLQNNAVMDVADVISTYVFRLGVLGAQYSSTTAIGIFQSFISVILLLTANKLAKKFGDKGIW